MRACWDDTNPPPMYTSGPECIVGAIAGILTIGAAVILLEAWEQPHWRVVAAKGALIALAVALPCFMIWRQVTRAREARLRREAEEEERRDE